jgi:AraC-like DNA-binding protein
MDRIRNVRSSEPTVKASVLTALPGYLRARDLDVRELLAEAGIDPAALSDRQADIPLAATAQLFDIAARRLGDPAFGLSYAREFPPGGTGLLGHIVMSAPTVRDVFIALGRFLQVHMSPVGVDFDEGGGIGRLSFSWPAVFAVPQLHFASFYMAGLVLRLRQATGPAWVPLSAEFQHRAPDMMEPYHSIFGTRLGFERKENAIVVDATTLARRMPVAIEGLHESIQELGELHLREQTTAASMAARLQTVLAARLSSETSFDLETVAGEIGLPARALQWRLEQQQTSYEKVLLATRIVEAERYLRDTTHQLTRIAALLGFSELSAFTRWTHKQFDTTPSALRHHLRSGGRPGGGLSRK